MIELTLEQHEALSRGDCTIRDVATATTYVLVSKDVYDRWQTLLEDDWSSVAAMNEVMAEDDANDPYLERYRDDLRDAP